MEKGPAAKIVKLFLATNARILSQGCSLYAIIVETPYTKLANNAIMATKQDASTVLLTKDTNAHQELSRFPIVLHFPQHVETASGELRSLVTTEIKQGASTAQLTMDIIARHHSIKIRLVSLLNVEME